MLYDYSTFSVSTLDIDMKQKELNTSISNRLSIKRSRNPFQDCLASRRVDMKRLYHTVRLSAFTYVSNVNDCMITIYS